MAIPKRLFLGSRGEWAGIGGRPWKAGADGHETLLDPAIGKGRLRKDPKER